jgi:hypothetical protein
MADEKDTTAIGINKHPLQQARDPAEEWWIYYRAMPMLPYFGTGCKPATRAKECPNWEET